MRAGFLSSFFSPSISANNQLPPPMISLSLSVGCCGARLCQSRQKREEPLFRPSGGIWSEAAPPPFRYKESTSENQLLKMKYSSKMKGEAIEAASKDLRAGTSSDTRLKIPSPSAIGENDLLTVGPGVLGQIIAEKWQKDHPGCQIYGQTMTTNRHDALNEAGIKPSLRGTKPENQFPYVIFCAPPSQTADYPGGVRLAALNWNGEGSFLFTSSGAAYDCSNNGFCDEDSPVVPIGRSPRTDVLLKAENVVLEFRGCVVRLAGLYISFSWTYICYYNEILYAFYSKLIFCFIIWNSLDNLYKADKGAHVHWLEKGIVEYRPDHILNLIHYEDAASLSLAIMKKKLRGRIFLGCDNHPLSRQEIMDCVTRSGKFTKKFQGFTGTNDPLGKRMNNSKTRAEVGWEPKYPSFPEFLDLLD